MREFGNSNVLDLRDRQTKLKRKNDVTLDYIAQVRPCVLKCITLGEEALSPGDAADYNTVLIPAVFRALECLLRIVGYREYPRSLPVISHA